LGQQVGSAIEGRLGLLVGDELAELGLFLVTDRLLQRDRGLRGALDRIDLFRVDAGYLGNLLRRRLTTQLSDQLALGTADLVQILDYVHRDADRTGLVGERTSDRLTDPPGRISRKPKALAVVELLGSTDQPERALLNQIEEGKALVAI